MVPPPVAHRRILGFLPLQMALAAGISWQLAAWLVGQRPYFAPLAAVLSLQPTPLSSLRRGAQRTLGVMAGVFLALGAGRVVGVNAASVTGLVLVGTFLARQARLGPYAVPQVAVTALLVLSVGHHSPGYAVARCLDTMVGVGVAVALEALLPSPDPWVRAQRALRRSLAGQVGVLRRMAAAIRARKPTSGLWRRAQRLEDLVHQAREELALATEGQALRPLSRQGRETGTALSMGLEVAARSFPHVRAAARLLEERLGGLWTEMGHDVRLPLAQAMWQGAWALALAGDAMSRVPLQAERQERAWQAVNRAREALAELPHVPFGLASEWKAGHAALRVELTELLDDLEGSLAPWALPPRATMPQRR